jgi:hypothetical protein
MGKVMGLWLNTNDNRSYNNETLVGAWKRLAHEWTPKQISYDSCVWIRSNEEILIDQKGYTIIRDVDGLLKNVLLSKWPRKEGEQLWWVSFQLIEVLTMVPRDLEKDEEREVYTDI